MRERECPVVSDNDLPCQKPLYVSQEGEKWPHAGGHFFASAAAIDKLDRGHYDARRVLAGEPVDLHMPEDCPDLAACLAAYRVHPMPPAAAGRQSAHV